VKKTKTIVVIILTLLVLITILQNTQAVETKLLLLTVTMPKALLIIITLLVGFILGFVATNLLSEKHVSHRDRIDKKEEEEHYEKRSGMVD
jgi:uncharacterized integral membrane protein